MRLKNNKENGSASCFISLEDGVIKVEHGTDEAVLYEWTANKGDWHKIFNTIRRLMRLSLDN